jgi:hypothetical protein
MSAPYYLQQALLELVKAAPQKQRLAQAFSKWLVEIDGADLPAAARAEFAALRDELESVRPLPGETAVMATVRKMSAVEAERAAARIVAIAGTLLGDEALAPVRSTRDSIDTVVPLFAAEA